MINDGNNCLDQSTKWASGIRISNNQVIESLFSIKNKKLKT